MPRPEFTDVRVGGGERRQRRDRRLVIASRATTTQVVYLKNVHKFLKWCVRNDFIFDSVSCLDELLADYFHYILDMDLGKSVAKKCYYGVVMLLPEFKLRLPVAKACLAGFEALHPSVSYPPMSWDLAGLVAMNLVVSGNKLEKELNKEFETYRGRYC